MKKLIILIVSLLSVVFAHSQTTRDLFSPADVQISWLGVDFSHVKLIGDFSQFGGAGEKDPVQIRDEYFPAWNRLFLNEPDKYDIKGMLRNDNIVYDIDMIFEINSIAPTGDMISYNAPDYSVDDIEAFVSVYDTEDKGGIGVLFLAECLNKIKKEAYFHFVAISMKTKEILLHERFIEKPRGFGLRNYWAGAIYKVIKEIKNKRYETWEKQFN